jgi:hypothetical protein
MAAESVDPDMTSATNGGGNPGNPVRSRSRLASYFSNDLQRSMSTVLTIGHQARCAATAFPNSTKDTSAHLPTPAASSASTVYPPSYGSPLSLTSHSNPEDVPPAEAAQCFEHFRSRKLKFLPFMHIPPETTAAQFQQDHPFVWLVVLSLSVRSTAKSAAIGQKIRRLFAEKIVVENDRSMESLLAMLCYLGWAFYQMGNQPFLCLHAHMLTALVEDLCIDRPPLKDSDNYPMACMKGHGFMVRIPSSHVRNMEERRAVLAAYVVTSS